MYQEYSETLPQDLCFALFYFIFLLVKHLAAEDEQIITCCDPAITSYVSCLSAIMLCRSEAEAFNCSFASQEPAKERTQSTEEIRKVAKPPEEPALCLRQSTALSAFARCKMNLRRALNRSLHAHSWSKGRQAGEGCDFQATAWS